MAKRLDEAIGGLLGSADSVSAGWVAPIVWLSRKFVTIFLGMAMTMGDRHRPGEGTTGGGNGMGARLGWEAT
jgi:hypothetical protein